MEIIEVGNNSYLKREFLRLPTRIYRNNPYWIRPLDADIEGVFDPGKNKFFENGDSIRFLAKDSTGQTVGRIAAFYNEKTALTGNDQPTGGVGFFECANDRPTAFRLFDAARNWLVSKGMEAMDGPVNFGERNNFWGLLTQGYELPPNYGMDYHMPYYRAFFEAYGFLSYYDQFTYYLPLDEERVKKRLHPAIFERAQRIYRTEGYQFRHVSKADLSRFASDFRTIYNKAWAGRQGIAEMTAEQATALMNKMKPILVEELMWFGYFRDEPIAFYIMLPELNRIFRHTNGKMNWFGKLKFLYHTWRKTNSYAFGVLFGVVPEFQRKGVESAIILAYSTEAWKKNHQFTDLELNWIGDFNPKMISVVKMLGADLVKIHTTYRYLFDREKPFSRHPVVG